MMRIATNENGGVTEVNAAVSADARALIPRADTAKDSAASSHGQAQRMHSPEAVGVGITRFLADFRERQALDAEWEFQEMCAVCRRYPSAINGVCFSCASRGLPC